MFRIIFSSVLIFCLCFVNPVQSKIYDPFWMFSDNNEVIYTDFAYCDTFQNDNFNCIRLVMDQLPDTGSTYNNTKYICFNYKFSSDTFFVRDEWDTSIVRYKDKRPGYAGFKTYWEYGMIGYPIARFNNLIFAHKGPNQNHKVTVGAWYNDGTCGSISYKEILGTFYSSPEWKLDTLPIPEKIRFQNDTLRNNSCYYELLFHITNLDPSDTTSGEPGCLKIDDIKLTGYNPIDTSPKSQVVNAGKKVTFKVGISNEFTSKEVVTYQWNKNGTPIQDANNPEFIINAAAPADSGVYTVDVHVASSGNTFTSWGAVLNVNLSTRVVEKIKNESVKKTETQINDPDEKECGCGSGAGLALLPPLWFRMRRLRRKK